MLFPLFLSPEEIKSLQADEALSDQVQKRTPEQIEAIYTSGQNVLVSASAGSGKTFVMVERIIDKILRGVSIEDLFISTFTVKAARELKERLEKKLLEEIRKTGDTSLNTYLNKQLQSLYLADIGTMDAFTQKLVSDHGYSIGISPKYRIMQDKSEQDILKNTVYKELFADYLEGDHAESFIKLVKNFSANAKNSRVFREAVYKIYYFSQSTADPEWWMEKRFLKAAKSLQSYKDLPDQTIGTFLFSMQDTADQLKDLTELEDYEQLTKKGLPSKKYLKHLEIIERLYDWAKHFDHYYGKEKIGQLALDLTKLLPTSSYITLLGQKYPIYKQLQEQIRSLRHLDTILTYQGESLPLLELLQAFVTDFSRNYLEAKRQENAYEFSDIAHFAIRILEEYPDIRQTYQQKYHEVMVDEYQDNNHMQERLLELLSTGHNRFMVGDIKQSIYRFRQADPQIFNEKFKDYQENPDHGKLILLKENFRSQSEVINATNAVFSHLMDENIGDILYDQTHFLVAGSDRQKVAKDKNKCQLLIYDLDSQENSSSSSSEESDDMGNQLSAGEIKLVAKEIIALHQKEKVAFSDITLLVSSRTRNDSIFQTFDYFGIPLVADGGQDNYLKSVEVMVMLDTLRTINNPLNDYALVALLRSPMFAFDEDQLTRIALQNSQGEVAESFYEKITASLQSKGQHPQLIGQELFQKLAYFDQTLKDWRTFSKTHSLYDLIWKIFNDRFYFDYVSDSPKGEQAQANLYALALRASQFEKTGFKGLSRFIGMIDKILSSQNDLADVAVSPAKNAVNLMTIHKSKGLEFKYVFILSCDKKFSMADVQSPLILNRQTGIGIKYLADLKDQLGEEQLSSVKVYLETLPYQLHRDQLKRASLSEQMRLLYVAMTRAEKKLFLVGKGSQEKLSHKYDGSRQGNHLPQSLRESSQTFQDWLLAIHESFKNENLFYDISYVGEDELSDEKIGQLKLEPKLKTDNLRDNRQSEQIVRALDMLEKVEEINERYKAAINLPTVRTPSQVKKFYQSMMDTEGVDIIEKDYQKAQEFKLPDFSDQHKIEASQIGSSLHELMQRIKISEKVTKEDILKALDEVEAEAEVKEKIDVLKIQTFFEDSRLGQLIQEKKDKLHREAAFAILKKDLLSQEKFVVRGIIDGYLLLEDRIILFDYKTDKYKNSLDLKDRYTQQLSLYEEALIQAYGIKKVDKYLVLLGGEKLEVLEL
ncbi:helicase-exonuclease AddAB subunit AddA [Streptococcus catagoni]|uniref:helicase-exonuclease AddAB subunit AddA n=1 Tax=Streptococcus catagoni TaxID=2654874 RepID=UPI001409B474|nr:helicase-exonuclease AddAB subunit AddA [Streptococcus catagoni]